jgi:hypothetical protein
VVVVVVVVDDWANPAPLMSRMAPADTRMDFMCFLPVVDGTRSTHEFHIT